MVTKKNRRVVLVTTGVIALSNWSKPILNKIVLPAHAMTSPSNTFIQNLSCLESSPIQLEFSFCNNTGRNKPITVVSLNSSTLNHLTPALPVTIAPNSCQSFSVSAISSTTNCADAVRDLNYTSFD